MFPVLYSTGRTKEVAQEMAAPPAGTVTFLFTDIEGSTKMWERDPRGMQAALDRHDEILRQAIEANEGHVFKTVGDAFCAAFATAPGAVEAALAAQRGLLAGEWEQNCVLRSRMALHTGAVEERDGDYFGPPMNRVARLLSAGHGGQTLLSLATQELVRDQLTDGVGLSDLGERRLKDLFRPEHVFQLVAPDLPADFPPLRTLESRRNNLPPQPTPLVGREREVREVRERLHNQEVRLLTLTGPGGTGKTRLSLQAAADLLDAFGDGVFFVPLAAITDPSLFFTGVAGALGVRQSGATPLPDLLKEYLSRRELLLVLDNFEQVLQAAPFAGELLSAAPRLKVLATSRIPLGIYGEHEYAVPPLSAPDPKRLPPVEALSQYEAVRLFIERAEAVKAGFEISNENALAIAGICARLDGLPLAIELAAARIKLLPPEALLARLSNRLKLLTGGARDLPARHQTLRGAIEWSHDLLDEGEKTLFARLAVFSGGRTLEAIEAVCDAADDLPVDALDGVSSLLDKNLLLREEGPENEPRFAMLETIHEFAREKLRKSGEAEEVRRLHAEYFLRLAEEAEPDLVGPDEVAWLDRLEAEHDNFRAALSWSLGDGNIELGLRLAGALRTFWFSHCHWREALSWYEQGLKGVDTAQKLPGSEEKRFELLAVRERLLEHMDRWEERAQTVEEMCEMANRMGGRTRIAQAYVRRIGVLAALSNPTAAERAGRDAAEMFREMGDAAGEALAHREVGYVLWTNGDHAGSLKANFRALRIHRNLGDRRGEVGDVGNIAQVHRSVGNYQQALRWTQKSVRIYQELEDGIGEAMRLATLASIHHELGELETALPLVLRSVEIFTELGVKNLLVAQHSACGTLYLGLGAPHRALEHFRAAARLGQEMGYTRDEGYSTMSVGASLEQTGDPSGAAEAYSRAVELLQKAHETSGAPKELSGKTDALILLAGVLHRALERSEEALEAYEAAAEICRELGNLHLLRKVLLGSAGLCWKMGHLQDAAHRYEEALDLAREQSEAVHEATALASLSVVYRDLHRLRESLRCGRGALELLRDLEDLQAEAYVLSSLAESYNRLRYYPSALSCLKRSLRLRRKVGDSKGEVGVLRNLARVYDNLGDTGQARDASEEAARKETALEVARVGAEWRG